MKAISKPEVYRKGPFVYQNGPFFDRTGRRLAYEQEQLTKNL